MVCHECDLLVDLPVLDIGERAICPRCRFLLASNRPHSLAHVFAYSVAGLVLLCLSIAFPFLSLSANGQANTVTLFGTVAVLFSEQQAVLAGLVFAAIIGVPALLLAGLVYVSFAIRRSGGLPGLRRILRMTLLLVPWSMAEIFVIGILVSFVKIVALAEVNLGMSFWAYVLFTLCLVLAMVNLDRRELWRQVLSVRDA